MGGRGFSAVFSTGVIFLIVVLMSGCGSGPVDSFKLGLIEQSGAGSGDFENGAAFSLREFPDMDPEMEGKLAAGEDGFAGPEYEILYPEEESSAWESSEGVFSQSSVGFHILYSSDMPVVLETRSGTEKKKEDLELKNYSLPGTEGKPVRIVLPLGEAPLRFFRFRSTDGDDPSFRMRSLALQRGAAGDITRFYLSSPGEYEGSGSRFRQYGYSLEYSYQQEMMPAVLSGGTADGKGNNTLGTSADETEYLQVVEYSLYGEGEEKKLEKSFRLSAREGTHTVYFYSGDLDFEPQGISIEALPPGFQVERISIRPYSLFARSNPEPIPADPGVILRYSQDAWRRSDWELFSWNLFSNILIFDFRDYAVQSAFLKRLSFFVEKKGSAGRLLPNSVIDPLHGWNAHDYRAKDLARFFQLAKEEDFLLNPEEYMLRDILLDRGILRISSGNYEPGEGGLLSISRESSDRLRYLFITHEGYHGLYFASPEYRRSVEEYWSGLSEAEQRFWRLFLDWKWYNTEDNDLVINEFQAYLMQQHISYVDTYFKEYTIPRFLRRFPEFEEEAGIFLERYPDHFTHASAFVEESARSIAGITSGDLVCLREGLSRE